MYSIPDDLELKELDNFSGTKNYFDGFLGTLATDGVKYISNNGYSWLITDSIAVIKTKNLVKEEFLVIKLKVLDNQKAVMTIENGNGKVFYTQNYDYTTAKRDLTLYFQNNVIMLSSEY